MIERNLKARRVAVSAALSGSFCRTVLIPAKRAFEFELGQQENARENNYGHRFSTRNLKLHSSAK